MQKPIGGAPRNGRAPTRQHGACAARPKVNQANGGPRAPSGAAVRLATHALGAGCKAKLRYRGTTTDPSAKAGGAPAARHNTQSSRWGCMGAEESAPILTSLTAPEAEHTNWLPCGLTTDEATATHTASANHTNTQRGISLDWRRACKNGMAQIMSESPSPPARAGIL